MTEMLLLVLQHHMVAGAGGTGPSGRPDRNFPNALIHHRPKDSLAAKFSMEFCMAVLLLYGKAGLTEFTDEVVNRPEVQEMIRRVDFGVDPVTEAAGYNKMTTIIEIKLKDGSVISGRADVAKGNPANPMSYDEVAAKFLDCAALCEMAGGQGQHHCGVRCVQSGRCASSRRADRALRRLKCLRVTSTRQESVF